MSLKSVLRKPNSYVYRLTFGWSVVTEFCATFMYNKYGDGLDPLSKSLKNEYNHLKNKTNQL